jgi:hypothetical protein
VCEKRKYPPHSKKKHFWGWHFSTIKESFKQKTFHSKKEFFCLEDICPQRKKTSFHSFSSRVIFSQLKEETKATKNNCHLT